MTNTAGDPLLTIEGLRVTFTGGAKPVRAVDGVDLTLGRSEVVALLGESGSGKSVTLRSILRLHPEKKTRIEGRIGVAGTDVMALRGEALHRFRGKTVSMIFQEPMLALDPVYTVGQQIVEAIRKHESLTKSGAHKRALELFQRVRIPSPERRLEAYPHEMSGGMRQRAALARTLCTEPEILLLDEPFSALDSQTRIAIADEIGTILRQVGCTVILVTHDIAEAIALADRVVVLSARPGRIKSQHQIRFPSAGAQRPTPLKSRDCPEFTEYFNMIWRELEVHVEQ